MIEEARWQLVGSSVIIRQIEASPYVFLSRTQFGMRRIMRHHRGIVDGKCAFVWFKVCLDEEESCGHNTCERALRRSNIN